MQRSTATSLSVTLAACLLGGFLLMAAGCGRSNENTRPLQPRPVDYANARPAATSDLSAIPTEQLDRIIRLFNRGVGLMDQYKPREAAEAFEELVELAPAWTTGRLNLGIALLNSQSPEAYERAERELNQVIVAEPDSVRAHYALGMLLVHLGRSAEAVSQFQQVLRLDPEDGDTHYQLGVLLVDDDPAAGRRHLEIALKNIPHHASACYRLQSLLRRAGEIDTDFTFLLAP